MERAALPFSGLALHCSELAPSKDGKCIYRVTSMCLAQSSYSVNVYINQPLLATYYFIGFLHLICITILQNRNYHHCFTKVPLRPEGVDDCLRALFRFKAASLSAQVHGLNLVSFLQRSDLGRGELL